MSVSPAASVAPSSVLALRERVHARGGLILEAEIDLLRAQGPGGAVGYVLEGVFGDHPDLSAASRLQLVQLWQRQGAWVEAHELAQTQAFEQQALADAPRDAFDAIRGSIAAELGLMTGSGAGFAHSRLEAARLVSPTGLLAETHQCLLRGWITTSTARMLADAAGDLIDGLGSKATLEQMKAVTEQLQARVLFTSIKDIDPATGIGIPRAYASARDAINRAVNRIDPDRAARRKARAHHERGVFFRPLPDEGLAIITATLPIADATEMFEHLSDLAQSLHDETPDGPTVAQLRADILVSAVCRAVDLLRDGKSLPERPTWRVGLVMDLATLMALREGKSELPGIGEIDPELARILAEDAQWQTFIHSPLTGEILDQGSATYRPSEKLRNFIRARDPHCTFPGCRKRSHRCQLDHITPFPTGPTTRANLHPLCQHHHNLKTHAQWQAERDSESGTTTWTSQHGVAVIADDPPPF